MGVGAMLISELEGDGGDAVSSGSPKNPRKPMAASELSLFPRICTFWVYFQVLGGIGEQWGARGALGGTRTPCLLTVPLLHAPLLCSPSSF